VRRRGIREPFVNYKLYRNLAYEGVLVCAQRTRMYSYVLTWAKMALDWGFKNSHGPTIADMGPEWPKGTHRVHVFSHITNGLTCAQINTLGLI